MVRTSWVLLAGLLLTSTALRAADEGPAGTWKVTFFEQGQPRTFWLIKLETKDEKWTGSILASAEGIPAGTTLADLRVTGDRLRFTIRLRGQEFGFDGKVPKEKDKKILGSLALGRQIVPAQLEPSRLKNLDRYEVSKEVVSRAESGPEVFNAVNDLLRQAAEKEAKPEEVRSWADKAFKAAEPYGVRWQREIALRAAQALADQDRFAAVALEHARRAERLLEPQDEASAQMQVLNVLAKALNKADRADEAKEVQARLAKLEGQSDQEYLKKMPPFQAETFKGRKGKSERAVLVELFTGAQCPPCVAADLAFDALGKTYQPADVVLLQYHLHIPGADPLTSPDSEARQKYYGDEVEGTPTIFFNGKSGAAGGGPVSKAEDKYKEYRDVVELLLEKPERVRVKATALQKGNAISISAKVSGLEKPGESIQLRLVLVEERVRYTGGNGLRFHHHVVRALPGGAKGKPLTEKTDEESVTIDLEELRKKLSKYLDNYAKEEPFPSADRPLELKDLRVIAFVQDDRTKEILQAVQVEVQGKKSAE